jgi:hypothetical protein
MAALFGSAGTGRPRMVGLPIGAPAFVAKVLPIGLLASPLRNGLAVCDFSYLFHFSRRHCASGHLRRDSAQIPDRKRLPAVGGSDLAEARS